VSILLLIGFKPYVLLILLITLTFASIYKFLFKQKFIVASLFIIFFTFLISFVADKPKETVINYLTRKQFDFVNVGKGGLHVVADTCFYYFQPHQYESLKIIGDKIYLTKNITAYKAHFGSTQKPLAVSLQPNKKAWKMYYFQPGCMSYIETTPINNSSIQLIKNIPEALVNSAIRPWPSDPGSKLKIISFIESLVLFVFLIYAVWNRRKLDENEKLVVFGLMTFALLLFLLIGWTTPVLGAIARYRFPAQLALFIVGFILLKSSKFNLWKTTSS
jgi:general stress protein CsbA